VIQSGVTDRAAVGETASARVSKSVRIIVSLSDDAGGEAASRRFGRDRTDMARPEDERLRL